MITSPTRINPKGSGLARTSSSVTAEHSPCGPHASATATLIEDQSPLASLSLMRNFSWTFLGNIVCALCQWAMLICIARLSTADVVGQYALGLAVSSPIMMFCNLHLKAVLV